MKRKTADFPDRSTRLVLDSLPQLVAILDRELRYVFANRAHFTWFGLEPSSLGNRPAREVFGEEAFAILGGHCTEALQTGGATFIGHAAFTHGGGRHVHFHAVTLDDDGSGAEALLVVLTDLTEHKLIEQALDDLTKRNLSVMATAVDGIIVIDERGTVQSFNPGAERQFGYAASEIIGRNVNVLMPAPHAEAHDGYLRHYLSTGERRIIGIGREVSARRRDGTEFPIDLAVGEFTQAGRRYFTGFTRDISARKEAERTARARLDELAQVVRQSSMNAFATEFAHEVYQPLTAIVTMAQAQLRNLRAGRNDSATLEQTLERIAAQGVRTSGIVQQMRELVRREKTAEPDLHDARSILGDALALLDYDLHGNGVSVHKDFHEGPQQVLVNRVQIEQVAVNLIQNAVQAMLKTDGERRLTVRTRIAAGPPDLVEVSISDTGVGLPEKEDRVFEPFFTTKEHGMGQGLAISRSIIENHGGMIRAQRNDGRGATLVFTLPVA